MHIKVEAEWSFTGFIFPWKKTVAIISIQSNSTTDRIIEFSFFFFSCDSLLKKKKVTLRSQEIKKRGKNTRKINRKTNKQKETNYRNTGSSYTSFLFLLFLTLTCALRLYIALYIVKRTRNDLVPSNLDIPSIILIFDAFPVHSS